MSHTDTQETVTIATKSGPVIINKTEFDPKVHKLHVEPAKKAAAKKA